MTVPRVVFWTVVIVQDTVLLLYCWLAEFAAAPSMALSIELPGFVIAPALRV